MPDLNVDLLDRVNDLVQLPEVPDGGAWGQATWRSFNPSVLAKREDHRCQTSMCFAGWAIELAPELDWLYSARDLARHARRSREHYEGKPYKYLDVWFDTELVRATQEQIDDGVTTIVLYGPYAGTHVMRAEDAARDLLGLTSGQSSALFAGRNDRAAIDLVVQRIKNGVAYPATS